MAGNPNPLPQLRQLDIHRLQLPGNFHQIVPRVEGPFTPKVQPEVQVGVLPPVSACILPQQVGLKKAVELNALGAVIGAAEAKEIGLVNQVYPVEEFDAKVDEYLAHIDKLSRPVVRLAKKTTVLAERERMLEHLERVEKIYLDELMKLAVAPEGIAAFLEKRTPEWKHE